VPRLVACIALAAVVVAGCGTQPLTPPDPTVVTQPGRSAELRDPRTRLRFVAPINWTKRIRHNPGVVRISSGDADVSGWAYARSEPLPKTPAQLAAARDALVKLAQQRNPTFKLSSSDITQTVHGASAVELRGTQRILGQTIVTHSVHIYRGFGEYVFEALAPARDFQTADQKVLEPLLRSLDFSQVPTT
jgi:hypothetical protein